jgi:hypothetical protein
MKYVLLELNIYSSSRFWFFNSSTLLITDSFIFVCLVANLPAENFSDVLSEHTSGVYFGWAGLSTRGVYKMVMSIGWNPYFDNTEKTIVSVLYTSRSMLSYINLF